MARTGRPKKFELPLDEIRELAGLGWSQKDLAERYGCSRSLISLEMIEHGIERLPACSQPGSRNGAWKGGRHIDIDGYVLIHAPDHPHATGNGRVREHRLVMERILGRFLEPGEVVHHIDGDRQNNDPSNLELFASNGEHLRTTREGQVPQWSEEGKERIRQGVIRSAKNRRKPNHPGS
jgi:hypothetical protein